MSSRFGSAIIVQIVVAPFGKPHELFRVVGEREQSLAKGNRNGRILLAVHDQERSGDTRYALVRMKLIPQQPTYRQDRKSPSGNVPHRGGGGFQDKLSDRDSGRQSVPDGAAH